MIFGDTTPEALAWSLATEYPVGGVMSNEAGVVLGGYGMAKDSVLRNLALLNSLWDGQPHRVTRRTSESFTVRGARLTMGLATQADTVRAFFDGTRGLARGTGFAARFLMAWPVSTQGSRTFREPPAGWPGLEALHKPLMHLLDAIPQPKDDGTIDRVMLELQPAAHKSWVEFHDEVEEELRPGGDVESIKDVASKAADNCVRLAALFHLLEHGTSGAISRNHVEAAASIIGWHLFEARRFFGEIVLPVSISNASKLDAWILARCRQEYKASLPRKEIQRLGPPATRDGKALDDALTELRDAGRIDIRTEGRMKRVHVNPKLPGRNHGAT